MPYVTQERRKELDAGDPPKTGGDLNYLFSMLTLTGKVTTIAMYREIITDFWNRSEKRYEVINTIAGAVLNCPLEFQRRARYNSYRMPLRCLGEAYMEFYGDVAGPYENQKRHENGDIFT